MTPTAAAGQSRRIKGEKPKAPGDGAGDEFVELTFGHHRRRRFTDWILANWTLADRVFADGP
jgi:hypothetical protein